MGVVAYVFLMAMVFVGGRCLCAAGEPEGPVDTAAELVDPSFLVEVTQYLWRWYLDESDADRILGDGEVRFLVRELHPALDEGDRSRLGEIAIPQLGVSVLAKKADYRIEELGLTVRTDAFKVIEVSRGIHRVEAEGFTEVTIGEGDLRDHRFRTRNQARFPEGDLLLRMRRSARQEIDQYLAGRGQAGPQGDQVAHLAPLSRVANDAWVFWENGRMLLRYASDIDLEEPGLWDHDDLAVRLFHIDEQTVVSLDEVPGSNAYLTRDFVGRVLFNCIVLGRRLVLTPLEAGEGD